MNKKLISLTLLAALALSGCGLFGKKDSSSRSTAGAGAGDGGTSGSGVTPYTPVEIGGAGGAGMGGTSGAGGRDVLDVAGAGDNKVYFDFDSTNINDAGKRVVSAYGKYLADHSSTKLRLEGHGDERGTREYNVGLGERRAKAVQEALTAAGASAAQLSVVSFGEERPADPGHDEAAWAKNRRVEIVKQ